MKKLYRKGTVHPSPQIKYDDQLLSLLPAAIFSLTAALSASDREVLAYLISTSSAGGLNPNSRRKNNRTHPPLFHCDCFSCYTSYWVRWDSSSNRKLIHEIIDAFEDGLEKKKRNRIGKKDRRKKGKGSVHCGTSDSVCPNRSTESILNGIDSGIGGESESEAESSPEEGGELEEEKGSVRRFMSFIGEKISGVWV